MYTSLTTVIAYTQYIIIYSPHPTASCGARVYSKKKKGCMCVCVCVHYERFYVYKRKRYVVYVSCKYNNLLLLAKSQRITNVLSSQLDTKSTLHLTEDILVGDSLTRLVFVDNLGLLVDELSQIFLGNVLFLTALLNGLTDRNIDTRRRSNVVFTVNLCNTTMIGISMTWVGQGRLFVSDNGSTSLEKNTPQGQHSCQHVKKPHISLTLLAALISVSERVTLAFAGSRLRRIVVLSQSIHQSLLLMLPFHCHSHKTYQTCCIKSYIWRRRRKKICGRSFTLN